jgi:PAS domain S-box-containing protein
MNEQARTNPELIEENASLKQQIQELEQSDSERKQVEEALRKSEANYRQLFDNSPTGIFQANFRTGKFTKANDAFCEYLGYSQKEITSLSPYDILTNEGKQLFSERLSKMNLGDKVPENPEFEIIDKNGKRRLVQLNTKNIYDSEGLLGADVVAHDITERKRAEEALRTQNKTFSQVLNGLDALVYVVDMKTYEIVFINTYGQNIWGDIKGKICWQTIQTDQAGPCEFCTNSKLIGPGGNPTEGVVWEFQNTVNKRWYDCRDRAIHWPDGRIVRIEIATDITRRKQVDEVIKNRERELEAKTRNLEELNTALKVLLKQREDDKNDIEKRTMSNVKDLIIPYIEKLKKGSLDSKDMAYLRIVESNLNGILSPFSHRLSTKYMSFTPKELQIAHLIAEGKTTKEIAELLNTSTGTIDFHRNNIRNKLNLKNRRANLRSYLLTLS